MWKLKIVEGYTKATFVFDDYELMTECLSRMAITTVDKLTFEVTYEKEGEE